MDKKTNLPSADTRSLTIYQIMVGSFLHGDGEAEGYNSLWGPDNERKDGNLRGVINALEHIAGLGATAIWLTPIFDSSAAEGGEKLQATGYFANDYFKIDPHFGTEDDLRERRLYDYVRRAMIFRRDNPAMWRGTNEFNRYRQGDAEILVVTKTDPDSDNRVVMIFADRDTDVTLPDDPAPHPVKAYIPELLKLS